MFWSKLGLRDIVAQLATSISHHEGRGGQGRVDEWIGAWSDAWVLFSPLREVQGLMAARATTR